MDWANIINIISAIISFGAAIKTWKFKNETESLKTQISNNKELNELIIFLTLCNEKILGLS